MYEYQESDRDIWNGGHSAVGGEKRVRDWKMLLIAIDIYINVRVCWDVTGNIIYSSGVKAVPACS